jgi:RNA polymerase sigma-70 factor (ECF subfamily)
VSQSDGQLQSCLGHTRADGPSGDKLFLLRDDLLGITFHHECCTPVMTRCAFGHAILALRVSRTPLSLLERLRGPGDPAAWERFVKLYTPLLSHWARRLGLNGAEAADLVQDVLTLLVQKLPVFRYDPAQRFRGWLWTVTRNCCRARQRRGAVPSAAVEGMAIAAEDDVAETIAEEEYRQYLTRRALELMQAEFQPATWQAFWQCVVEERPAADVARELEMTENAVYLARGRVLRRLRSELAGLLD